MKTETLAMAAAVLAAAGLAHGQTEWTRFTFGGVGDIFEVQVDVTDEFPHLQVTDAFLSGDRFRVEILDRRVFIEEFDCSEPTTVGDEILDDYDAALADDRWSSGERTLGVRGSFVQIRIHVTASPFGGGGAAYRFTEAPCRADIDGDGELTLFDFLGFQNFFDAGDLRADFDGDGDLTLFDFLAFQNAFDLGCE
ncbi:MAG: GC-type dockerin domain-anchored protein [Planctomycetota bacterium]